VAIKKCLANTGICVPMSEATFAYVNDVFEKNTFTYKNISKSNTQNDLLFITYQKEVHHQHVIPPYPLQLYGITSMYLLYFLVVGQ
jgi:hypothetical protein